ncbi:hypothetical protein G0Q06_03765 [Puniceicoccales bacterium CK1056]|uniref:peptidylprolyl isomerase n=1 Tax=Oceanipulchritudo coccoides TaxID=2706888 RepID=A0A6B2LY60_9BACT|nr:EF-hand domain-containing protein [Oceanipulchritudo coccoides]NDV61558.1 hypothetical protein [Oceanipulchritudo coccoides]
MKAKRTIIALLTLTLATASLSANKNDLNRDKSISWDEFEILHKARAAENGREYKEQQIKWLFEDKDSDGDGVLSYKEFGAHPVDLDQDKSISYEEFAAMHKKRAERNGRTAKDGWIKGVFEKKDLNGDGSLSYKELAKPIK